MNKKKFLTSLDFSPKDVFLGLAQFDDFSILNDAGVELYVTQRNGIQIAIPHYQTQGKRECREKAYKLLNQSPIFKGQWKTKDFSTDELIRFGPGALGWLLAHSRDGSDSEQSEQQVQPDSIRKLFVSKISSEENLLELFNQLNWHAADTKIALRQTSDGNNIGIFLVQDDVLFDSTLAGLIAGNKLAADVYILRAFKYEKYFVYLPETYTPNLATLSGFVRLCVKKPEFFNIPEELPEDLLAIYEFKDSNNVNFFETISLAGLYFPRMQLWPSMSNRMEVRFQSFIDYKGDELIDALRRKIEDQEEDSKGYRLSLKKMDSIDRSEELLEQIEDKIHELEDQRAALLNFTGIRRRLLKFNQNQIHLLVKVLTKLSPNKLKYIKYFFHGITNTKDPIQQLGSHYLLFDPEELELSESFFELNWLSDDFSECTFSLDPYWNFLEEEPEINSMLFVPSGYALCPTFVDWNDKSKSYYIKETISYWFQSESQNFPSKPLYLFEHASENSHELKLRVLDLDSFVSLSIPHTSQLSENTSSQSAFRFPIGWINSNLLLFDTEENIEILIKELERLSSIENMIEFVNKANTSVVETYVSTSKKIKDTLADNLTSLEKSFINELNATNSDLNLAMNELKQTHVKLQTLRAALAEAVGDEKNVQKYLEDAEKSKEEFSKAVDKFNILYSGLLTKLEQTTSTFGQRVKACLTNCRNRLDNLNE